MSLEGKYANDSELLADYQKNLLEPGWAGELRPDELSYIRAQLSRSRSLKRKWGFKPSVKRFPEKHGRLVARDGMRAIRRRVLASAAEKEYPE